MDKRLHAAASVMLGAVIGLLGDILFYRKPLGFSVPLFVAAALGALYVFSRSAASPSQRRNLWLLAPLAYFAAMVPVRADATLTVLNLAAVLWLAGLFLHYRPLTEGLDEATLREQSAAVNGAAWAAAFYPAALLPETAAWLRERRPIGTGRWKLVGRGLLLTAPILVVFGVLLGSADVVFGSYLDSIIEAVSMPALDDLIWQLLVASAIGWLACGALYYGVSRRAVTVPVQHPTKDEIDALFEEPLNAAPAKEKPKREQFSLSMIETGIVLGGVNLMFGAFVLVQFAYFFGGRENIALDGYTFSDYARRGFFELLAVSVLTLGLILWLDRVTLRPTFDQHRLFRALATGIVALTSVMLISASNRMTLYEDAYGYTHLRVYTHIFMLWLGVLFAVFLAGLFRPKRRIFPIGVMLCALGFLATLNHINVDATIARQNIARYHASHDFDVFYLYALSEDAVPEVVPFYLALDDGEVRDQVGGWLAYKWRALQETHEGQTLFSLHLSRDAAYAMLRDISGELP